MALAEVPTEKIVDWESYHEVLTSVLRFPDYYGQSGNAFTDCLRDIVRAATPLELSFWRNADDRRGDITALTNSRPALTGPQTSARRLSTSPKADGSRLRSAANTAG
jgi:RNAse (barnase) inhibitor barstar